MTEDQIRNWKRERDIARAIQDDDERNRALTAVYDHKDDMMMECIQHQADRVKQGLINDQNIEKEIAKINKDLSPCIESDRDYRKWKLRAEGASIFWKILKYIAAAGGGAAILKFLGG